jgi:ABC-2 type transport system ATP-binding protein
VESALQNISGVNQVLSPEAGKFVVETDSGRELRPELARVVVGRGWELMELKSQEFTLEDVFLNLVTEEDHEAA